MSELFQILASYVPASVVQRIAANPVPLSDPVAERFSGAALFLDITGFTSITERLAQSGDSGVEELSRLLNDFFTRLITVIHNNGGEVVKFSSDALLAIWPVYEPEPTPEDALRGAVLQASDCALLLQSVSKQSPLPGTSPLNKMRVSIGAGDIYTAHLGGIFGRWEYVVSGPPLVQASLGINQAFPGGVVLSSQAWKLVHDHCHGKAAAAGYVRLLSVPAVPNYQPTPPPILDENAEAALRAYTPGAVLHRLAPGDGNWLGELRWISVLFINLPDLDGESIPLDQAQNIMQRLQKALYRYEGAIYKLNIDDKGITLIAALGLPPLPHEDDAVRGLQTALRMQNELLNLNLQAAIGVASGRVFCGSVGSPVRREYIMIGNTVNLAARLMESANALSEAAGDSPAGIPILCDEITYQAARSSIDCASLPPIQLKGQREPQPIYSPLRLRKSLLRSRGEIVGRGEERDLLGSALQKHLRTQLTQVVLIEGGPGFGKSRLVEYLVQRAEMMNLDILFGSGEAIEKTTPYYAWRNVYTQLIGPEALITEEQQVQRTFSLLVDHSDLLPLAPLLNNVLPLNLADNELTSQMSGQVRADNTRELLVRLLQITSQNKPKVLVIEDAHWLDSASWALLYQVSQELKSLLIVIAARSFTQNVREAALIPQEYTQITQASNTQLIHLDTLSPDQAYQLVCQRLRVSSLPDPVASLIRQKAAGHPFFSEELGYALRDTGLVEVIDGECRLAPGFENLQDSDFPNTIQGVITRRIDHLSTSQQVTLEVASVIGRVFSFNLLSAVYPGLSDQQHLRDDMDILEILDITPQERGEPDLTYMFKHIITQEVSYYLMPPERRSQLHQAVAKWFEDTHADDLSGYYSILAHHWTQAIGISQAIGITPASGISQSMGSLDDSLPPDQVDQVLLTKAIGYLEKAAQKALREGLYKECVDFLYQTIQLAPSLEVAPTSLRRAKWQRQIAEAYYGIGNLPRTQQHNLAALDLMDMPSPKNRITCTIRIAANVLRRTWQHSFNNDLPPTSSLPLESEKELRRIESARIYDRLSALYFFSNDALNLLHSVLKVVHLAEPLGPSPELARGYAAVCVAAGTIPLHGIARTYGRWAIDTARLLEQPSALGHALLFSNIYHIGAGDFANARSENQQAAQIFQQIGDNNSWGETLTALGLIAYFTSDFIESRRLFDRLYEIATHSQNVLQQAWGLAGKAAAQARLGITHDAIELGSRALQLLQQTSDPSEEIRAYAAIGWGFYYQAQWQGVLQTVSELDRLIGQSRPTVYSTFEGYAVRARAYLDLWEISVSPSHPQARYIPVPLPREPSWQKRAKRALKDLSKFARVFPIAGPRARLLQGYYEWLSGKHETAVSAWQESLSDARQLEMLYEQGLAHYYLGRLSKGDQSQEHLADAQDIFQQIRAINEVQMVQNIDA